jgi:hypothetical protein
LEGRTIKDRVTCQMYRFEIGVVDCWGSDKKVCIEICGPHVGECSDYSLMGYDAVSFGR